MNIRRLGAIVMIAMLGWTSTLGALATEPRPEANVVLRNWFGLMLELVRHTPTYSPPVASRAFGYLGVIAFESRVGGSTELNSLVGQLAGFESVPPREPGAVYDDAVILDTALAVAMQSFFQNTGPTGQHAVAAAEKKWRDEANAGVSLDVVKRSEAFGRAMAESVIAWSQSDGGAKIENMGFPLEYDLPKGDGKWVPTSLISQQQLPLLPAWGDNRTFVMPSGATCPLAPPFAYSESPDSDFYKDALEVYQTTKALDADQTAIARFWSDDPMLSTTPPGHWISIALQVAEQKQMSLDDSVDLFARLGVAMSDAFVGCWHQKFIYNLVRPVTYIKKFIDPKWEPILITPPFPEYPSGHSTVSAAAATVLTAFLGDNFAFDDETGGRDGRKPRHFTSFLAAADEAGISRLYGGIHFRAAIERGLEQGRCIGAYAVALRTRK